MCVLDKFHLGMSSSAVGCEFNVSESAIHYVQKKKEKSCQSVNEATEEGAKVTSTTYDEAMEKWLHLWIHEVATIRKVY